MDFLKEINNIEESMAFNLEAIKREISDYKKIKSPSEIDRLSTFAYTTYYAGKYESSRDFLNTLILLHKSERSLVKLAQCELRLGNFERVIKIGTVAIKEFPDSHLAHETLAFALLETGQYKDAMQMIDRAIAIRPTTRSKNIKSLLERILNGNLDDIIFSQDWFGDFSDGLSNALNNAIRPTSHEMIR